MLQNGQCLSRVLGVDGEGEEMCVLHVRTSASNFSLIPGVPGKIFNFGLHARDVHTVVSVLNNNSKTKDAVSK
jgi:hypothetical protein